MTVIESDLLDSITALREAQGEVKTLSLDIEALRASHTQERAQIQTQAWEAGWANSIGSALDNLLQEHGLEGRPASSRAWVDVTCSVPHEHAGGPARHPELGPARHAMPRTLRTVWERRVVLRVLHNEERTCVCDLVTEEQVREVWAREQATVDYSTVRIEAIKPKSCSTGTCPTR